MRRLLPPLLSFLGVLVAACGSDDEGSPPAPAPEAQPDGRQRAQADAIAELARLLAARSGWPLPVDVAAIEARERDALLRGPGDDATFLGAAWRVLNDVPQGHQNLFPEVEKVCSGGLPIQNASRLGVCGRPGGGGVVATIALPDNPLGLQVGDTVVEVDGLAGDALLEAAYDRPVCGAVFPSASGRRFAGAASFFNTVPSGAVLTVRASDGSAREVTVPSEPTPFLIDCTDPFGRERLLVADATTRPDGVAVIRLPSFIPFDEEIPEEPTEDELEEFISGYLADVLAVFDTVRDAPAIVWDVRGNGGGLVPVALAIVSGFPSARPTTVLYCRRRIPDSSPPVFEDRRFEYRVVPGGPFAYDGEVAVLTDGLTYSAGDYFALATLRATDALVVGAPSAAAWGGGEGTIVVRGPPAVSVTFDPIACFDVATDAPLEGDPPEPILVVDYEPSDLAAGRDTVLERAVAALRRVTEARSPRRRRASRRRSRRATCSRSSSAS